MKKLVSIILCGLMLVPGAALAAPKTAEVSNTATMLQKSASAQVTGLKVNNGAKVYKNQQASLQAQATGATSYKFVYSYNNWSDWAVIQDFSSKNTVPWTPQNKGSYVIFVDAKGADGKVSTRSYKVNVDSPWSFTTSSLPSKTVVGDSYSLSANATGNTSGLQYKFVYSYNNWSDWKVFQEPSSKSTATFTPKDHGEYEIFVDVIDKNGNVETKTWKTTSDLGWSFDGITGNKKIGIGSSTTFKANCSTSSGMKYKFVYSYNNWSDWKVFQDPSSNSSANFTPSKPGNYEIFIDVIDAKGNVRTQTTNLEVAPEWKFTGVTASTLDGKMGETVTIKPTVTGDTKGLKYKFVKSYLDWYQWGVIKEGTSNTAEIKLEGVGNYEVFVDVIDPSGYVQTQSIKVLVDGGNVPVINADWFSTVTKELPKGEVFNVMDVQSGKRFKIRRWAGTNHMDAEPYTVEDTAKMKDVFNGEWTWTRRPVIVMYKDKAYAASMHSMPHDVSTVLNNGYPGHFCVHFLNSKTHGSNRVDPDHKRCVDAAASVGKVQL